MKYRMFVEDDLAYGDSDDFEAKDDITAVKIAESRVKKENKKTPDTGRKQWWRLVKVSRVKIIRKVVTSEELTDIETFSKFYQCCRNRQTA